MAVVLRFGADALLRCRFAVSPLNETNEALRSFTMPGHEGYHLPWQRQARPLLERLGIGPLLTLLSSHGYQPDFLSPPPEGPFTEIGDDLRRVRATPPERVAAEVARCVAGLRARGRARASIRDADAGDPAALRDLLADCLARAWSALVEPWWPQLRDVLDADIAYRARQLADAGISATLNDLDPKIRWRDRDRTLRVAVNAAGEHRLTGDGLVLLPSVFAWPGVGLMLDPPWQPTVAYPARGIGLMWRAPSRSPSDLSRLIGGTRAVVLTALSEPASTTGLAARCGLPVSSVSEHLAVLRAAGLVTTVRAGRYLLHQRTALGVALAGTATPPSPSA